MSERSNQHWDGNPLSRRRWEISWEMTIDLELARLDYRKFAASPEILVGHPIISCLLSGSCVLCQRLWNKEKACLSCTRETQAWDWISLWKTHLVDDKTRGSNIPNRLTQHDTFIWHNSVLGRDVGKDWEVLRENLLWPGRQFTLIWVSTSVRASRTSVKAFCRSCRTYIESILLYWPNEIQVFKIRVSCLQWFGEYYMCDACSSAILCVYWRWL